MSLKTILTLSALLLATPVLAQDQIRQQDRTRDPSTHVDGSGPIQQRDRTRDLTHEASQDRVRERSRSMSGGGTAKGSGAGGGAGSGGGCRGGR